MIEEFDEFIKQQKELNSKMLKLIGKKSEDSGHLITIIELQSKTMIEIITQFEILEKRLEILEVDRIKAIQRDPHTQG